MLVYSVNQYETMIIWRFHGLFFILTLQGEAGKGGDKGPTGATGLRVSIPASDNIHYMINSLLVWE